MIRTLTITTAVLGLFAAAAAPAFAAATSPHAPYHDVLVHERAPGSAHETKSKHVRYTDVDISTSHGAETLVRRIKNASEMVCGPHKGKMSLKERTDYKQCMKEAMDDAVQSVNSPTVTDAYKKVYG